MLKTWKLRVFFFFFSEFRVKGQIMTISTSLWEDVRFELVPLWAKGYEGLFRDEGLGP